MKIIFEKLKTSNENVYVDFGDGRWQPFSVNDVKSNGIIIPDTCNDYSKIRIKGKSEVFLNLDVITGIKSIEEQEYYSTSLSLGDDYGSIYINNDCSNMFWSNNPDLYIYYNNEYYEVGGGWSHLCEPDLNNGYIKLNNDILPISMNFQLVDGQFSDSSVDPENLVDILTYEKGVGGTASINGVEVNYKTDYPNFGEDYDNSNYHWDSSDISDYGDGYLYNTEDGYETSDSISEKLRRSLLENGPIDVYTKLSDGQYYKMPIKLVD